MSQTFEIAPLPPLTDPLPLRSVAHPTTFTDTMEKTLQELQAIFININLDFIPKLNEMAEPISVVVANLELIQSVPGLAANAASSATAAAASASAAADSQAVCEGIKEVLTEGARVEAEPNAPALRNNRGASQFADPVEDMDAANRQWTEGQIGAMAAGMAWPEHKWELLPNLSMRWCGVDRTGQYLAGSGTSASTACFVSTDYGESQIQRVLPASAVYSHWDVNGPDLILCSSTAANVAYQSKNSGASWSVPGAVTAATNNAYIPSVAVHGDNGIFVVHGGGTGSPQVRITTDRGSSWTLANIVTGSQYVIYGVFCNSTAFFVAIVDTTNAFCRIYRCAVGSTSFTLLLVNIPFDILRTSISDELCMLIGEIYISRNTAAGNTLLMQLLLNTDGFATTTGVYAPILSGTQRLGGAPLNSSYVLDSYKKYGCVQVGMTSTASPYYYFTRDYGATWNTYSVPNTATTLYRVRITDNGIYWASNAGVLVCRDYGQEAA